MTTWYSNTKVFASVNLDTVFRSGRVKETNLSELRFYFIKYSFHAEIIFILRVLVDFSRFFLYSFQ